MKDVGSVIKPTYVGVFGTRGSKITVIATPVRLLSSVGVAGAVVRR
jgi:hypothetical protein